MSNLVSQVVDGSLILSKTKSITASVTLTAEDSGSTLLVNSAAAAVDITLPSPTKAGLIYKLFIVTAGNDITVSCGNALGKGVVALSAGTTAVAGGGDIVYTNNAALLNSYSEFISDGTLWRCNVQGTSSIA